MSSSDAVAAGPPEALARLGVWELEPTLAQMPVALDWLCPDEHERVRELRHPRRRGQFLAAHWQVRQLLAIHFGGQPADWAVQRSKSGAPQVLRAGCPGPWQVSLAHSGSLLACAVAGQAIGIDLEHAPRARDFLALARTLYDPQTCSAWQRLDAAALRHAFLRRWTLDEAHAKARGQGLKWQTLRRHAWVAAADRGEGWCWTGPDLWLSLVLSQAVSRPLFRLHGAVPETAPQPWRLLACG